MQRLHDRDREVSLTQQWSHNAYISASLTAISEVYIGALSARRDDFGRIETIVRPQGLSANC